MLQHHFKEQVDEKIRKDGKEASLETPYPCPECGKTDRDVISMRRHYSYTHKALYDFCTQEDCQGLEIDEKFVDDNPGIFTETKSPKKENTLGVRGEDVAAADYGRSSSFNVPNAQITNGQLAKKATKPLKVYIEGKRKLFKKENMTEEDGNAEDDVANDLGTNRIIK